MLNRLELNGRTRDFYDIYLIYKKEWQNINIDHFRKAIDKTLQNPVEAFSTDFPDEVKPFKKLIKIDGKLEYCWISSNKENNLKEKIFKILEEL